MFPVAPPKSGLPSGYGDALKELKARIQQARLRTVLAANAAMIQLYWDIGRIILARQKHEGWGAKVIDRLSADIRDAFPDMSWLSPRNLRYMRDFASAWPDPEIVQRLLPNLPWGQNVVLLDKVRDPRRCHWQAGQYIRFQLTIGEKAEVVANCDHLARLIFSPVPPNVFTEHGTLMAATLLARRTTASRSKRR